MKQFYIHQNDQQQGPFSLEDLKEKKITKETMIWFEGAEGWIPASQVEELKSLLKIIPPPLISPPLI
ncbi:MAG: DUF4339 domain-containing protein, partial [Bacteroidales bacterium]